MEKVAQMSLNRGVPSTSQVYGLNKLLERIDKNQETMRKKMEDMFESLKSV